MEIKDAVSRLAALAQESRLRIFKALVEQGPTGLPAGKIAEQLGLAPATLSFHLKELSHANLLHSVQDGRFVIYRVNFEAMQDLLTYLTDNCCAGSPCLAPDSATTASTHCINLATPQEPK
jgi:ArsR family transcriptional regulator